MADGVKICHVILNFDSDYMVTPVKLRGFLGHLFTNISEFHHHSENSYHYPLIQYKRADKKLLVVGIGEYANVVFQKMSGLDHITTETQKIPLNSIEIKSITFEVKVNPQRYKFVSPWLALNEKNYAKFKELNDIERKPFLEKILVGNILSLLKGLGIFVEHNISVSIVKFSTRQVTTHQNKFAGIFAEFDCNTELPEFLGLGKSVTKGLGVITRIPQDAELK